MNDRSYGESVNIPWEVVRSQCPSYQGGVMSVSSINLRRFVCAEQVSRQVSCEARTAYTNGSCCAAPIAFKKAIRVRKEGGGRVRKEGRQQGGEATSNEQRAEPPSHQQQRATSKPPATSRASEPPSRAEQTKRPSRSGKECVHTLRRFAPHRWSSRRLRSSAAAWGPSPMPYTINGEWDPCKARVIHRVRCVDA